MSAGRFELPEGIVQDVDHFERPYRRAIRACLEDYENAANQIGGARRRSRAATYAIETLDAWTRLVCDHFNRRSFEQLPVSPAGRYDEGYILQHAMWVGIFKVLSREPTYSVTAVLFLRYTKTSYVVLEETIRRLTDGARR